MEKSGGNIGKLVEEDGKNTQLSTKVAKILQTHYSPFSSIFHHFSLGMLLNTPPPQPPRPTKSGFLGFSHNVVPIVPQNTGELSQ